MSTEMAIQWFRGFWRVVMILKSAKLHLLLVVKSS